MPRPLRILVVEDDPSDALLLKRAFARAPVKVPVHFVRDGQEAVDYLKRTEPFGKSAGHPLPTLVLLDLKMPKLDGFEVLEWLRSQPALDRVLVLVFSASEEPDDMGRAYALGADSYVVKPQDAAAFTDIVRDMEKQWLHLNATPECGCESGSY